jgi:hypothetical protein
MLYFYGKPRFVGKRTCFNQYHVQGSNQIFARPFQGSYLLIKRYSLSKEDRTAAPFGETLTAGNEKN